MKKIIFLLVSIVCFSCSKDEAVVPDYLDSQRFPLEIQPILKTFLAEGNKRGVYCDINKIRKVNLTGIVYGDDNKKASGYYEESSRCIYLDTTSFNYKLRKEALIFHELGHGLLGREHKNGEWNIDWFYYSPFSIMNGDGFGLPIYTDSLSYKRDYYINELFNPNTPTPHWVR